MIQPTTKNARQKQVIKFYKAVLTIFVILLSACSRLPLDRARTAFYGGDLAQADFILKDCQEISQKDKLLCLMEKGMILHYLKDYEKSSDILLNAATLIRSQDQISISDQSSAVLVNDKVTTYKGEYCERLWVHTFLMMNFLLQQKNQSALVEAKQALEVFDEHPEPLKNDHFTRALIALCFENMNLWDDARIEYDKLTLAMDEKSFVPPALPLGTGELVLFIGQGRMPPKVSTNIVLPPSIRISIPRYAEPGQTQSLVIRSDGQLLEPWTQSTNMGKVAQKSLEKRSAAILSRQVLRAGAKEAIAEQFGKNNQAVEVVARVILFLLEEADTRSWEILPGRMLLVRLELTSGLHNLEISSGFAKTIYLDAVNIVEGTRVYQSLEF